MASIAFSGRLTRDPELKEFNGSSFVSFSVADSDWFRARDGEESPSQFFDCKLWGPRAQGIFEYGRKGGRVYISGQLVPNNYTNREGQLVKSQEVNAQTVNLLETRSENERQTVVKADRQPPDRNAGQAARPDNGNRAAVPQYPVYQTEEIPF